ncbi:DUF6714 family protein [Melittangium boletus]|uniref:Uncharacterized protein n=1 Tax=Melittangium boletus DSM 14713 TaxID=1294270 RepID=A0A250IHN5_9BACT|nr:DUF6714 family protein [Melittangium boletus]ATB30677.1 hypothetical protein MEBOL_004138 [Melittangium boletus DSM 14713]
MSRKNKLRELIEAAFADTPKPGNDRIGHDPNDWESTELARAFKGRHWKELTPEELQYNSSSFLSPEGFHYYFPAYLLAALEDHGNLLPHTVFGLILPGDATSEERRLRAWHLERFERFSADQKHAIREFLEYARDEASHYFSQGQAPSLALERYWVRY